ncbi:MAG: helix-turn-helix transcriptional regulator [Erysipelotrichaceae bacterium]|nr:helix-turn-helix transcriptional regulator [Erysipelotrichaceae bacterium]
MKNYVKEYREDKKLTQEALANHLNVSRQTIISIENGKYVASLTLALKLSIFFNTSVENLFSLKEEHEN